MAAARDRGGVGRAVRDPAGEAAFQHGREADPRDKEEPGEVSVRCRVPEDAVLPEAGRAAACARAGILLTKRREGICRRQSLHAGLLP